MSAKLSRRLQEPPPVELEREPETPSRRAAVVRRAWILPALLTASFLGAVAYRAAFPPPPTLTAQQVDDIAARRLAMATPAPPYSEQIYQTILPSLVMIEARRAGEGGGVALGTGIVVNEAGDILTALHVVDGASRIRVQFSDGSSASAEVTSPQPEYDIAVLHPSVPPELIVPAVLGSSSGVRIGDEAYAVGHPLGLVASLSAGVVSGLDRSYDMGNGKGRLQGLIQFDAAVNPGSSGGPLLNRNGEVIGIVTALANPSEGEFFIGVGFAVPIAVAGGAAGAPDI
ncbi:MAG TPA: trypsin-like peptidase domain-containing protein [Anaerolineales bacterium]|nr:trypsin-like peptidase domain-containing protein [Anaerolineales bacterium]